MTTRKVLIVEDDKMLCTIFGMFLNDLGHELLGICQNGREAIEYCRKKQPDVILMDIHLSGSINGIETATAILQIIDVPIIFLSSDTEEATVYEAIHTNSYGYLIKPTNKTTLGIAIELAVHKHLFEHELKISHRRYRDLLDDSFDGIIIINDNLSFEFINNSALKLFDFDNYENYLGKSFLELVIDCDKAEVEEILRSTLDFNTKTHFNARLKTFKGESLAVISTGSVVDYKNKKTLQLIIKKVEV